MRFLRSNTAVMITVGPFYDKADGVTIETGLTVTNERITLTADTDAGSAPTNILDNVTGATSGTSNDLNYITGNDAGLMQLELAAADVNRVGRMFLSITDAANHVPVFHEFTVLPQAIYDWLIAGSIVPLPANVTTWNGTAVASPATAGIPDVNVKNIDNDAAAASGTVTFPNATLASTTNITAAAGIAVSSIATDAITAASIAADAVTELRSVVSGTSDSGTTSTMVDAARTEADTDYWRGAIILFTSGTLAGQARRITAFTPATDTITFTPAATQAVGTHTYEIHHDALSLLASVTHTGAAVQILSGGIGVTAIANNAITAAMIADGAIDAATFATGAITAAAIASDAITDAKVASDVTIASVTGSVGSVTAGVTVTTNNDKTGYGLSAAAVQAIWDALTSALTAVGSIGKLIIDNLNAAITSRMATYAQPTGFLTAIFPGSVASPTNITAGTIENVTNLTNAPTAGDLTATMKTSVTTAATAATPVAASVTGSIGSLAAQAKADVNTEVDTAITDAALATATSLALAAARLPAALTADGNIKADVKAVNAVVLTGAGVEDTDEWRPV